MATASQRSFESILDQQADAVERPSPAPAGTYDFIVKGLPEYGESTQKKTPFVRFTLVYQSPLDDVDDDELGEWLTDREGTRHPIAERSTKITFYTTPDALWRLTDFLEHCGIDPEGRTVRQMIDETPNCAVRGKVDHEASQDGQQVFARVNRTFKAE
jgi:hypothetical protein